MITYVALNAKTITVEAEKAELGGAVSIATDHYNYSGAGFVAGMIKSGSSIQFTSDIATKADYNFNVRYCNGTDTNKTCNLYINGTFYKTLTFTKNGGDWNKWKELTTTISLIKGENKIEIRYDASNTGNVNFDEFSLSVGDASVNYNLVDNGSFERDLTFGTAWTEWHPNGQTQAYGIDSGSGSNPPESAVEGSKRAYFYQTSDYKQSIHQGISLANGKYRASAWVKVSNSTPSIGRMEISQNGSTAKYVNMPFVGAGWKLIECEFTVTSGYVDLGFYCDSKGGTTVHIDSVSLEKIN